MSDAETKDLVALCGQAIDNGLAPLVAAELVPPPLAEYVSRLLQRGLARSLLNRAGTALALPRTDAAVALMTRPPAPLEAGR